MASNYITTQIWETPMSTYVKKCELSRFLKSRVVGGLFWWNNRLTDAWSIIFYDSTHTKYLVTICRSNLSCVVKTLIWFVDFYLHWWEWCWTHWWWRSCIATAFSSHPRSGDGLGSRQYALGNFSKLQRQNLFPPQLLSHPRPVREMHASWLGPSYGTWKRGGVHFESLTPS